MKKILLCTICFMVAILAHAEGHMTFKGVEIDGDLPSFIAKLEAQGFVKNSMGEDYAIMTGTFTAEEVQLYIHTTPKSNTVYAVSVVYKPIDEWPYLEAHYRKFANSLKTKYGEPIEEVWDVSSVGSKIGLAGGYSTARISYGSDNGGVVISIEKTLHDDVSTRIYYWDKKNKAKYQEEVDSDL